MHPHMYSSMYVQIYIFICIQIYVYPDALCANPQLRFFKKLRKCGGAQWVKCLNNVMVYAMCAVLGVPWGSLGIQRAQGSPWKDWKGPRDIPGGPGGTMEKRLKKEKEIYIYIYIHIFMCIYIYMYIHICIIIYKYMHLYIKSHVYIYICAYMDIYIHMYVYSSIHTYIYI